MEHPNPLVQDLFKLPLAEGNPFNYKIIKHSQR